MLIKKQICAQCNGVGCLECAWSGALYKNIEFKDTKINKKSKEKRDKWLMQ